MIRLGTPYDIAAMKRLWDECFNDNVSYIDFIFDKVSKPSDAMVYEEDGRIVAMLLMIPTRFVLKKEIINSLYVFGACTARKYRGQGIMTKLLKQAEIRAMNSGAGLSLVVPGDRALFDYYTARGYDQVLSHRRVQIDRLDLNSVRAEPENVSIDIVDPYEVFKTRYLSLRDIPNIAWSGKQMEFVIDDAQIYGGHCAVYNGSSGQGIAFFNTQRRRTFVNECVATSEEAQLTLLKTIMVREQPRVLTLDLPVTSPLFSEYGTIVPYGLAKSLSVKGSFEEIYTYMNMMLD